MSSSTFLSDPAFCISPDRSDLSVRVMSDSLKTVWMSDSLSEFEVEFFYVFCDVKALLRSMMVSDGTSSEEGSARDG